MVDLFEVAVHGARLIGEETGKGEAVVFLHAGVTDRRMWDQQVTVLGKHYRAVSYDRRGFGDATSPDETFSHVGDLKEVLSQLDINTATLVGCSQGGRLAIDFTLAFPAFVSTLVLVSPAVSGVPGPEYFPLKIQSRLDALDRADDSGDLDLVNELEAILWLDGPAQVEKRITGAPRELFLNMNGIALQMPELTCEIEPFPAIDKLPELSVPTLVISGDLDFPHVQERNQFIAEKIPHCKYAEMKGAAHLPNLEHPALFNKLLTDFLRA